MKNKIMYECNVCGARTPRWSGKCNVCNSWNSLEQVSENEIKKSSSKTGLLNSKIYNLSEVSENDAARYSTGITELDRVLGGGIMPGSFVLIGGEPGIGKSTLLMQMCAASVSSRVLYVTGEESLSQIKYRYSRLSEDGRDLKVMAETSVEPVLAAIDSGEFDVVIVDSIQSAYTDRLEGAGGSLSQIRECSALLMHAAKKSNVAVFVVGHVTKEGYIAGPKVLEHIVDTVLQFEGEKNYNYRILRALKNRFGSTNEIGIFEMTQDGLREIKNPSEIFLANRSNDESGIAISAAIEGSRPILIEVQALVSIAGYGMPQRNANGYDQRRIQMILAVLEKRLGLEFKNRDVFVNIAGGLYVDDTALDLAIAAALVSSFKDRPIPNGTVIIGEIGLTGEVRGISQIEQRIAEAEKLGFNKIVVPSNSVEKIANKFSAKIIFAERISLILNDILN